VNAVAERKLTQLEELTAGLEARRDERQHLESELARLAIAEQEAVDALIAEKPAEHPYRPGSEPLKLRQDRGKAERKLESLEPVIATLERQVQEAGAREAVEKMQALTARMQEADETRADCWREGGQALAEVMLPIFNRFAESLEQADALQAEAEAGQTVQLVRSLDPEAAFAWERARSPFEGARLPVDFAAWLEFLIEVCLDSSNEGHQRETIEIVNRSVVTDARGNPILDKEGKPRFQETRTEVDPGSRKYGEGLAALLPDLRGQDRRPELGHTQADPVRIFSGRVMPGTSFGSGESFSVR